MVWWNRALYGYLLQVGLEWCPLWVVKLDVRNVRTAPLYTGWSGGEGEYGVSLVAG